MSASEPEADLKFASPSTSNSYKTLGVFHQEAFAITTPEHPSPPQPQAEAKKNEIKVDSSMFEISQFRAMAEVFHFPSVNVIHFLLP